MIYNRSDVWDVAVKHYPLDRLTVVAQYDPQLTLDDGPVLRVAVAIGSKKDQWSKKRGYTIALGRLRCPRPGRKLVWEFEAANRVVAKVVGANDRGHLRIDLDKLLEIILP